MSTKKVLEDDIRKLRRKKTVCICIIVYAALCVLAFHSFTSIALGLIVIAVAAVKLKKYNEEIFVLRTSFMCDCLCFCHRRSGINDNC